MVFGRLKITDAIQKPEESLLQGVVMDRNELRRRQLGLDHYPQTRARDVAAFAFAGLAFSFLWVWCKLTGKNPDDFV